MARPLSEEKREKILTAAAELIAAHGLAASTAAVAKSAGVSEGTVFVYFPTKDELLNQLYLSLKLELTGCLLKEFPLQADEKAQCLHIWQEYILWGIAKPRNFRALQILNVSDRITERSHKESAAPLKDIIDMLECRGTQPNPGTAPGMIGSFFQAMASACLELIHANPDRTTEYVQTGFTFFWKGRSS